MTGIEEPPNGWMTELSETILEVLHLKEPLRLDALQEFIAARSPSSDTSYANLLYCLRQLRSMGLVDQEAGRFRLTDAGRGYLAGDVDPESLSYSLDTYENTVSKVE